jgi:hypothetical protein
MLSAQKHTPARPKIHYGLIQRRTGAASQQLERDRDRDLSDSHDSPFIVLEDKSNRWILHTEAASAPQKTLPKPLSSKCCNLSRIAEAMD